MHFCLISTPEDKEGEIAIVRACFDMGLNCFHLRKPHWSSEQYVLYLEQFTLSERKKIHVHAMISPNDKQGGIHLSEKRWRGLSTKEWEYLRKETKANQQSLSVSLHELQNAEKALLYSDYAFLSPVYDSISKPGYQASALVWEAMKNKPQQTKIIALGGVQIAHYEVLKQAGFDGVAVLGAFWNNWPHQQNPALFWEKATEIFAK